MPHQPKLTMPRRSGLSFLMVRYGDGVEYGELFGADVHALGGWAAKVADGCAQEIYVGGVFGAGADGVEAWLLRNLHGIVQRYHGGRGGIVGNEDGGEILVAGTGPLEWTFDGVAAADGFDGKARHVSRKEDVAAALSGGVVVIVDAGGGVGRGRDLVAESGGPGGRSKDFSAFVEDRGFHVEDVGVVEMESLADDEILIGVLEGDRGWGCETAFV